MAALLSIGCSESDGLDHVAVHGHVLRNGSPLEAGTLRLQPKQGNHGPTVTGIVENGSYAIPLAEGPIPGKYELFVSLPPPSKASSVPGATTGAEVAKKSEWKFDLEVPGGTADFEHHIELK